MRAELEFWYVACAGLVLVMSLIFHDDLPAPSEPAQYVLAILMAVAGPLVVAAFVAWIVVQVVGTFVVGVRDLAVAGVAMWRERFPKKAPPPEPTARIHRER